MRQEKWGEAEAIALNISSLDPLESKFRYSNILKYAFKVSLYYARFVFL